MTQSDMLNAIRETIEKHKLIEGGDLVIVGLSGGRDSVTLFLALNALCREMKFSLAAAHINHGIRGEAADRDQEFVRDFCKAYGVPLDEYSFDCKTIAEEEKLTLEEAGRKVRYSAFNDCCKSHAEKHDIEISKIKVAVAHNRSDQVETVLMRVLRGSGVDGLGGMDYKRLDGKDLQIIRPLLDIPRETIDEFCETSEIEACEDETNTQTKYTRNKVRKNLVPYLKENYNTNVEDALIRLSAIAKSDRDLMWRLTETAFRGIVAVHGPEIIKIRKADFKNLDRALRARVIMYCFREIGMEKSPSFFHVEQADQMIHEKETNRIVQFAQNFEILIETELIIFRNSTNEDEPKKKPKMKVIVGLGRVEEYVAQENQAVFDYDLFLEEHNVHEGPVYKIECRTRKAGDYLPLGYGKGNKKIQDLLIDLKVPVEKRDEIFLVTIGKEVLFIPEGRTPAKFSGKYKVNENTKNIIVLKAVNER